MARDDAVLAEVSEVTTPSHGSALPRLVEAALGAAGLAWEDVDGLAVSIGPGSFTGLRIGLSLAKGIAYAGDLPMAAVPTLEALAWTAGAEPGATVWTLLDARMREVYAASFAWTAAGPERRTPDEALRPDEAAGRLRPPCVVVGDAPDAYPILRVPGIRVLPFASHPPRGGIVARLGARRLTRGEVADTGTLEPAYVRPSQAELARSRPSR